MSDQIRTVLAGFDGTYGSEAGLRLGAAVATTTGGRLLVATSLDYEPLASVPEPVPAASLAEYERARREEFDRIYMRAIEIVGTTPFERRELGAGAARAISRCAAEDGADLIALGATHHGPVGRVFPGSVGQKVLNGAPCPVAVAPTGWTGSRFESVAVGFDGSAESQAALRLGASIASSCRATLEVLSVLPTHMIVDGRLLDDVEMRERWRDRLDAAVAHLPGHPASGSLLEHGEGIAETLAAECARHDLSVFGSRGYGPIGRVLLGSVSANLLVTPRSPVIAVPRPEPARKRLAAERASVAAT